MVDPELNKPHATEANPRVGDTVVDRYFQDRIAAYEAVLQQTSPDDLERARHGVEDQWVLTNQAQFDASDAITGIPRLRTVWQQAADGNYDPALFEVSTELTHTDFLIKHAQDRQEYERLNQEITAANEALQEESGKSGLKMVAFVTNQIHSLEQQRNNTQTGKLEAKKTTLQGVDRSLRHLQATRPAQRMPGGGSTAGR